MLYLDLETYSETPIKHGVHRYAETAEILLFAYAIDNGPAKVWDCTEGGAMPPDLFDALLIDTWCAHNATFDVTVIKHALGMEPVAYIDTLVEAYAHGLPGSLDMLCQVLGLKMAKMAEGKRLVQLFCQPRPKNMKLRRATRETHPEDWALFAEYARMDVEALRELRGRLPTWVSEPELVALDRRMNAHGVQIDVALAEAAQELAASEQERLSARIAAVTGGLISSPRQTSAVLAWLRHLGCDLPDLQGATLARFEPPNEAAAGIIALRQMAATTSTAKYHALTNATSTDGRLRGTLQIYGASRTGRWSGRLFQPQNLPRPAEKMAVIDEYIAAIKGGYPDLVGEPMDMMQDSLRGAIVAAEGKKFVVSDLAAIEGRMLAWLAGEDWKIRAYTEGKDLYVETYARSFGIPYYAVTKAQRTIGKVMELGLGYGGGTNAFVTFANVYRVDLSSLDTERLVKAWRAAHPRVVRYWYDIERAAKAGNTCRGIRFERKDNALLCRLPSGRVLTYWEPEIQGTALTYMGVDQYTRKWMRQRTYGGKLVENITQAAARDIIAYQAVEADKAGYTPVLLVHDEIVAEVPDTAEYTAAGLSAIMSTGPAWAKGLPLRAVGFESRRYGKDDG